MSTYRLTRNSAIAVAVIALVLCGYWMQKRLRNLEVPSSDQLRIHNRPLLKSGEEMRSRLEKCINLTAHDIISVMDLSHSAWLWVDEPPGVLCGVVYRVNDDVAITLYIAVDEPLHRRVDINRKWDYAAFLQCRVGRIVYDAGDTFLEIGPNVPRRNQRD